MLCVVGVIPEIPCGVLADDILCNVEENGTLLELVDLKPRMTAVAISAATIAMKAMIAVMTQQLG
jgi:hypothetical protein